MLRTILKNRSHWNRTAVIDGDVSLTYADLAKRAFSLCNRLDGLPRGNAALFLPDGADYLCAVFGAFNAGFTAFPLSTALTPHEIGSLLLESDAVAVITSTALRPVLESLASCPEILCVDGLDPWDGTEPGDPGTDPDSPMLMLCTSGTTGGAKIVVLSENNVMFSARHCMEKLDYGKWEGVEIRYLIGSPFCSSYAMFVLSVIMIRGDALVISPSPFLLASFYESVERHAVTHYEGGVTALALMERSLGAEKDYNLGSLRYIGFGGSAFPAEAIERLTRAFPDVVFMTGYGLTETSPLIVKPDKFLPASKLASVGVPSRECQVMIEDNGEVTDRADVTGEIVVKGPCVMLGYYRNDAATAGIIRDGWLHTGDVGHFDAQGYVYITGRMKNVILVRGFSVYPEEIESCLAASGLVDDCRVFGEPDGDGGEKVCCEAVPARPQVTEHEVSEWCARRLAAYKRPSRVVFTGSIAKTPSGKTDRSQ